MYILIECQMIISFNLEKMRFYNGVKKKRRKKLYTRKSGFELFSLTISTTHLLRYNKNNKNNSRLNLFSKIFKDFNAAADGFAKHKSFYKKEFIGN